MTDRRLQKEHALAVQMFDKIEEQNLDCELVIVALIERYKGSFVDAEPKQRVNETADKFSFRYNLWAEYHEDRIRDFNKWISNLPELACKY